MTVDLRAQLGQLNFKDPDETAGLIDMYVYDDTNRVLVGQTHAKCLSAFQYALGIDFEQADENAIVFGQHLQSFEARTAALRRVIDRIDQDPDIFGAPTQYSLDDIRPIPQVKNPLLGISRPYCRKGFNVPTDFSNMIIQREDGKILFTVRADKIGHENDTTGADNYSGQFDMVGGAHVYDEAMMDQDADEIYLSSLMKVAEKKSGITVDDVMEWSYLGTTTFQHTRGDSVFHHERHPVFLARVPQDWQPKQIKNGDVQAVFWATPEEAVRVLQDQAVLGFSEVRFNNNSRASTIKAFLSPDLGIITPDSIGKDVYEALAAYDSDPEHHIHDDPILDAIHSVDNGLTPVHEENREP